MKAPLTSVVSDRSCGLLTFFTLVSSRHRLIGEGSGPPEPGAQKVRCCHGRLMPQRLQE